MFCHRLTWNAWMSAFCGGGPVYDCVVAVVVCWFTVVGAPPEELQAASTASAVAAAARASARRATNRSMALLIRLCMLGAPLRPRAGGSGLLEHLFEVVALEASSWPSDLAPLPLPGSEPDQPSTVLGPVRQRLDQPSSGVMKPKGKLVALMKYFACTVPWV